MADEHTQQSRLTPDEAFSALGNEIRVGILRTLGDANVPLAFSDLYDRLAVEDSAQFNYHLDKLVGHFVRKTEEGYALGRPGRRVVESILAGAVTEAPDMSRTSVEDTCPDCDSGLEMQWRAGNVELFCPSCDSRWERAWGRVGAPEEAQSGYLGRLPFPPAGLDGRSPPAVLQAAYTWTNLEFLAVASEMCPRCAATVERDLFVCEAHDPDPGPCPNCESAYAARMTATCTNCIYQIGAAASWGVIASPRLLSFLLEHGLNPVAPESAWTLDRVINECDVQVHSTAPARVEFGFTVGEDNLALEVDENLTVLQTHRKE